MVGDSDGRAVDQMAPNPANRAVIPTEDRVELVANKVRGRCRLCDCAVRDSPWRRF
jgi:hypothetical protein